MPEGIAAGVEEFEKDDAVKAIVLIGGGRTFIAGADIKEFGKITSGGDRKRGPGLNAVLNRIENEHQAGGDGDSRDTRWAAGWRWRWPATTGWRWRRRK